MLATGKPYPDVLTLFKMNQGKEWQLIILQRAIRLKKCLFSLLSALSCILSSWPAMIFPLRPLMFILTVPMLQEYCIPVKLPTLVIPIIWNYSIYFASCRLSYRLAAIPTL
jgi:hypothetical protein